MNHWLPSSVFEPLPVKFLTIIFELSSKAELNLWIVTGIKALKYLGFNVSVLGVDSPHVVVVVWT